MDCLNLPSDTYANADGRIVIHHADCFNILPQLAENSVDCVITDPPYFLDGLNTDWDPVKLAQRTRHNGTVKSLPGGMKFSPKQGDDFEVFFTKLAAQVYRLLKPGAFFISFSQCRLYHRMARAAEKRGFEIRDMMAWRYEGQPKAFSQAHFVRKMRIPDVEKQEIIDKLQGRKTPQLKPQMESMMLAQKPREGTFVENWLKWKTGLIDTSADLDGRFPGTVMDVPKPKEKYGHLTVKPVVLIDHLIRLFSAEQQIILDPFIGSGTTAVAAARANRKCIGVEINAAYYATALKRMRAVEDALPLDA